MSSQSSAGGAAATAGNDFQARVAAWFAVQILAEAAVQPPFQLGAGVTLERLRSETGEGVDDLLAATSENGYAFLQVKHRVDLATQPDSALASALDQFVRQFVAERLPRTAPAAPWHRALDWERDRLVLTVGSRTARTIRFDLENVLRRAAQLAPGQPLAAAAVSARERKAYDVVIGHLQASWRAVLGAEASEEEMRRLLALARIQTLPVDEDETAEREAKNLLRQSVLRQAAQADAAWACLVQHCLGLAKARTGTDRTTLQQLLQGAGIGLRAVLSYHADIQRLRNQSARMLSVLHALSVIRVGEVEVKFARRCVRELRNAGEQGPLLVVGEPGAGKSGALHDLASALGETGDAVVLVVDRLEAPTIPALNRELGLEHDLVDVLANWPGPEPAWLIVDALDAARDEPAARTLRDLFSSVVQKAPRWRVVSSIRKFDLRYSPELQALFSGAPPSDLADSSLPACRHVEVRPLDAEELIQIAGQSPPLAALVSGGTPELQLLLTVVFNLRLAAELLSAGVETGALAPMRTQLELLDRYWLHRVTRHDGQGDAREAVLHRACGQMIELRRLRAVRTEIVDEASSGALHNLLRTEVLVEWQPSPLSAPDRYILTFPHHVLFDYAVARLIFRREPADLAACIAAQPSLVLVVRPSLELHFEHLWALESASHERFWGAALYLAGEAAVPEVGKLIGPSVAARHAMQLADLAPLLERLESSHEAERRTGELALRHMIGALVPRTTDNAPLVGVGAGPWCGLLERLSPPPSRSRAYTLRTLLHSICEAVDAMTAAQMSSAGKAARAMLEFAWRQEPRDRHLALVGIDVVCLTFASDTAASAAMVRRVLDPARSEFRYEELPWLTRQVPRLIDLDAGLVQEIYAVVYRHRETATSPTRLSASNILSVTSNRQQDFGMAHFQLETAFPDFLTKAPLQAVRALLDALDAMDEEYPTGAPPFETPFDFAGRHTHLRSDRSDLWDRHEEWRHQPAMNLLDPFEQDVGAMAAREDRREVLRAIVGVVVDFNHMAVVWRRLIRQGARFPGSLAREILPALSAKPILTFVETSANAGEFLHATFGGMDAPDRERIENALMALAEDGAANGEQVRDRLLGCLPAEHLVTAGARDHLAALERSGALPSNPPLAPITGVPLVRRALRPPLLSGGDETQLPADALTVLTRGMQELANRDGNQPLGNDDLTAVVPRMRELVAALREGEGARADAVTAATAWEALAAVATRIARRAELVRDDAICALTSSILLAASDRPEPSPGGETDRSFDDSLRWAPPAPRLEAAQGLLILARHTEGATAEVMDRITGLSRDDVAVVRSMVAFHLDLLDQSAPAAMWETLERLCRQEPNHRVLAGVLELPLDRLAGSHSARVAGLALETLARADDTARSQEVRRSGASLLARMYLWLDEPSSRAFTLELASQPQIFPAEAAALSEATRAALRHGLVDDCEPESANVRARIQDLLLRLLRAARESRDGLIASHDRQPFDAWPDEDQATLRSLAQLLSRIAVEVYHASGAYRPQGTGAPTEILSEAGRRRFYEEHGPLLDELAEVGSADTAHRLLETLESFVSFDPAGVFLRMARVVRAAKRGNYHLEDVAANLMVKLVERYLADYGHVLREDAACCAALLEILDTFISAGWPNVRQITYRLTDIFR
jgi:hypothetical protein